MVASILHPFSRTDIEQVIYGKLHASGKTEISSVAVNTDDIVARTVDSTSSDVRFLDIPYRMVSSQGDEDAKITLVLRAHGESDPVKLNNEEIVMTCLSPTMIQNGLPFFPQTFLTRRVGEDVVYLTGVLGSKTLAELHLAAKGGGKSSERMLLKDILEKDTTFNPKPLLLDTSIRHPFLSLVYKGFIGVNEDQSASWLTKKFNDVFCPLGDRDSLRKLDCLVENGEYVLNRQRDLDRIFDELQNFLPNEATEIWKKNKDLQALSRHDKSFYHEKIAKSLKHLGIHSPAGTPPYELVSELSDIFLTPPEGLIHGDAHFRNILGKANGTFGYVDWYHTMIGNPFSDLSDFAISSRFCGLEEGAESSYWEKRKKTVANLDPETPLHPAIRPAMETYKLMRFFAVTSKLSREIVPDSTPYAAFLADERDAFAGMLNASLSTLAKDPYVSTKVGRLAQDTQSYLRPYTRKL